MSYRLNQFIPLGPVMFALLMSTSSLYAEPELTEHEHTVPGESVANASPLFMKHFQQSLREYSVRMHQCSNPSVIDTTLIKYSPIDTAQEIPMLTGPIHEKWKILACGKKFYYYLGIAPGDRLENKMHFATIFKETDW